MADITSPRPMRAQLAVIAIFALGIVFGLDWTKDGKLVAINAGKRSSDAVLIRNFK